MKYENAWVRNVIFGDNQDRIGIPAQAIKRVNWNVKYPVYIKMERTNHLILTQDGSVKGIRGVIHNLEKNKIHYQLSIRGKFDDTVDEAVIRIDETERKIYVDGISWKY